MLPIFKKRSSILCAIFAQKSSKKEGTLMNTRKVNTLQRSHIIARIATPALTTAPLFQIIEKYAKSLNSSKPILNCFQWEHFSGDRHRNCNVHAHKPWYTILNLPGGEVNYDVSWIVSMLSSNTGQEPFLNENVHAFLAHMSRRLMGSL